MIWGEYLGFRLKIYKKKHGAWKKNSKKSTKNEWSELISRCAFPLLIWFYDLLRDNESIFWSNLESLHAQVTCRNSMEVIVLDKGRTGPPVKGSRLKQCFTPPWRPFKPTGWFKDSERIGGCCRVQGQEFLELWVPRFNKLEICHIHHIHILVKLSTCFPIRNLKAIHFN